MAKAQGEVYLLNRNPQESARLNGQHAFLVDLISTPIHPSIPIESVQAVADIATGTGIWLCDVASLLTSHNPNPSRPYYLHGFDISPAQFQSFPTNDNAEIHLSVQNCLQPFPAEHHGRYDLVHLRLLIGALRTHEYEAAVKNVFDILKPGGYLQWTECDMTAFNTDEDPQPLLAQQVTGIVNDATVKFGLSANPPELIEYEARRTGFVGLHRELFNTRSRPHLADPARSWISQVLRSLIPTSMVKTGAANEEGVATERVGGLLAQFERHCAKATPLANLHVVVGRKPKGVGAAL